MTTPTDTIKVMLVNSSVNFVDARNCVVGYDMSQSCCEYADWFIYDNPYSGTDSPADLRQPSDLPGYRFDPAFREESSPGWTEAGGMVVFRLLHDSEPPLYLHLFNSHNGYYGHGFTADMNGTMQEGIL